MTSVRWLWGSVVHRPARIAGAIVGVAITIALSASVGIFLIHSSAAMTRRAAAAVGVDWQVRLSSAAAAPAVIKELRVSPTVKSLKMVAYAGVAGFQATTGGTTQTTGAGKVVGIEVGYRSAFPNVFRQLSGSSEGIEIAQQTAANLHVKEGGSVTILRRDQPAVTVTVAGVVAMRNADAFFQAIGVPPAAAPSAPPDNVLFVPEREWHVLFDSRSDVGRVETQLHLSLHHRLLPTAPTKAFAYVTGLAKNLEARAAGAAIVGDNLAGQLVAVRADSLYATVLFLFLALPGVLLSIVLVVSIALSGKKHLIREQALLKVRGATAVQTVCLQSGEGFVIGLGGALAGVLLALVFARLIMGIGGALGPADWLWIGGSAAVGFIIAVCAMVMLVWREVHSSSVSQSRRQIRRSEKSIWRMAYLDMILIGLALLVYWRTAQAGYSVVMAPEGAPQVAVNYSAFIAPLALWLGGVLSAIRLLEAGLARFWRTASRVFRPVAGNLSGVVAASVIRQRSLISRGVTLVALAVAFAVSTAVFNTTYNAQSRVDAQLTNGADVTVSGRTSAPPGALLSRIRSVPGIAAAEPMMHRFAYVGNDLQDLYGIDPDLIARATEMSNAYFAGGNASATLALLSDHPDGVLVSEETKRDFQLNVGDTLNLRLQFADHQFHVVPFAFVGVVREFPTAPKDSFLVANASYIARKTGVGAREVVLLRTNGRPSAVAPAVAQVVFSLPGAQVSNIDSVAKAIGSGLTQINLEGLTKLELFFAVLFVMAATGLILALGLAERRRTFSILDALGASRRQLSGFMWSEGLLLLVAGTVIGALLGIAIAGILTTVLKGVFDPPPDHLVYPVLYLVALAVSAVCANVGAIATMGRLSRRPIAEELRRL